jgi:hypothetical protein
MGQRESSGAEGPTDEQICTAGDHELLALYSEVMGELMRWRREEHRDHWGPEEASPGPLAAVDGAALLRIYRSVHDEMMVRDRERPGVWEPRDVDPMA